MLHVRPLQSEDLDNLLDYWYQATEEHLRGMGADPAKLPARADFRAMLMSQLATPVPERRAYALIWELDGQGIGHTNTNPTFFGDYAHMHLHLWQGDHRRRGLGVELVKRSLPIFFRELELQKLYCEPYALNPAPNATLPKAGFRFEQEYHTIPGSINFPQRVKRWVIDRADVLG